MLLHIRNVIFWASFSHAKTWILWKMSHRFVPQIGISSQTIPQGRLEIVAKFLRNSRKRRGDWLTIKCLLSLISWTISQTFWFAFGGAFWSGFGSPFEWFLDPVLDQLLSSFWTSFWAAFGPALGQLLASFRSAFGQLLASFWPAFGQLLGTFWPAFWPPFWPALRTAFPSNFKGNREEKRLFWISFWTSFWTSFWPAFGQLLASFWTSFWPAFGQLLASSWPAFGQLSASFLASFWLAFCALFGKLLASLLISFCDDFCANFRARFWTTFGWFLGDSNAFSRKPLSKRWKPKILIEKTKFQVEMQEINKNPSEKCCKTAKSYRLGFRVRRFVPDVLVFCKKSVRESAAKPQNRIVFCQYSMFCLQCFSFLQKIGPGNA